MLHYHKCNMCAKVNPVSSFDSKHRFNIQTWYNLRLDKFMYVCIVKEICFKHNLFSYQKLLIFYSTKTLETFFHNYLYAAFTLIEVNRLSLLSIFYHLYLIHNRIAARDGVLPNILLSRLSISVFSVISLIYFKNKNHYFVT